MYITLYMMVRTSTTFPELYYSFYRFITLLYATRRIIVDIIYIDCVLRVDKKAECKALVNHYRRIAYLAKANF
jgi:hypothetical protein